jgi:intracellular septation protein
MKPLLDFLPLLAFFAAYKFRDIYFASAVWIVVASIQYLGFFWYYKKLQRSEWITWIAGLLFCSMTLLFHNESILKWKAPIVSWLLGSIFLMTPWLTGVTVVQKMMEKSVQLNAVQWRNLNYSWVLFFIIAGAANAYVAFYHASIWVDFKVFGSFGMTLTFVLLQGVFLYRYIKAAEAQDSVPPPSSLEDKVRDPVD